MASAGGAALPPGSVRAGVAIMVAGLLAAPWARAVARLVLERFAGWDFQVPWQTAAVALGSVWVQNGVWVALSAAYLAAVAGRAAPAPLGPRLRELAADVWLGVRWGVLLLFVNGLTARLSLAVWGRLLPHDELMARVERERGMLLSLFEGTQPPWLLALLVFTVAVVAPLGEEVLFRGLLHRALRARLGRRAFFVGAALFAAIHLYAIHFLPVFVLGALLAWIYEGRGSLVVPVVAHGTVNAIVAAAHIALRSVQSVPPP